MTRVEREIANPDAALVEAMREVDAMLPGSPPIAPPKATPPTLVGGNSVWRAPPPVAPLRDPAAREHDVAPTAPPLAPVVKLPWFAPYIAYRTSDDPARDEYVLLDRLGGACVSRAWLESHRYDLVQAARRL